MIDQGGRAEILPVHVLVEIGIDQDTALGEEFVEIGAGHRVGVDIADFKFALS